MNAAKRIGNVSWIHAVLVMVLAGPTGRAAAEDVTGEWEVKVDRDGRESFATLVISKKPDGGLAGKWGSNDLSDVKFDGKKLTFARTVRFGDQEFQINYEGTLEDGKLKGTLSSDRGSFAANAARPKPKSPALGRWQLKYTIGDMDIAAVLAVSEAAGGALQATWQTGFGENTVSGVKFQDGKLSLARKTKLEDREFESTYEGVVKGHKIEGTIKSDLGEIPAGGERIGANLIGKWELVTTTDQGTRTSLFTVLGDLSGRYESFGGEIPVKEIKLDGDQVAFSIEAGFGDQTFTIDFKGKLDGKTLKGETTSPRGTREVTGKKLEPAPTATSPAAAIAGTWEITRETQQGTRTAKLTIKEDMTATYTTGDATVPVTDLRLDGDQLSFKVTVKRGEREIPTEFKGKVAGTTLKGEIITARGAREATGKKLEPTAPAERL
jgi:hypothetical protein